MYCPKCGTKLPDESVFCSSCGFKISDLTVDNTVINDETKIQDTSIKEETTTEALTKKSKELVNKYKNIISAFVKKYKKQLIICTSVFVILLLLSIIYNSLYGFETFKWDKKYKDIELNYVTQNKLQLGINFSNDKKLNKIKYKTSCGDYEVNGKEIDWDLTQALGECEVEVSYKLRKLKKKYTIINPFGEKSNLSLTSSITPKDEDDVDLDGLTLKQEKELNTNPELSDSDMDGLDDNYEVNTSKTDPLKKDTDNDGLSDYDEVELGLDPLKSDSKGDGVKDGERTLTYSIDNDKLGVTLNITGKGNIASTTITLFKNDTFKDIDGLLDNVFDFYSEGTIENAEVIISYSIEDITNKGLDENNLVLYYFNEDTKELEAMPTVVDKDNKKITVTLKHFSKYVLGDNTVSIKDYKTQIMMVIDNSVSMYTYKQLNDLGYTSVQGADGNDSSFKRISLTNRLIDMFTGNYYFGIAHFAGSYINLSKFTDNKDTSKSAVNSIKNNIDDLDDGTNIVNALNKGISEFSKDDNNHYLILLTDGKDTNSYNTLESNKSSIISEAKEKDIKVCVIGLGQKIDKEVLKDIAVDTGCDFYSANDANALDEIYSIIAADINYKLVDTNKDGKVDGTVIADSGFIVTRDGFSFSNYVSNLTYGHCFGMATFAELYYTKKLPMSVESKTVETKNGLFSTQTQKTYSYDLSNTYFSNYGNLYDYKPQSNILKYALGFDAFDEDIPKDLRSKSNDTLVFGESTKKELTNSGLYDISIEESQLSSEKQLEKWGVNYKNSENALLNEDKLQDNYLVNNEDKQLLNAIYTGFVRQDASEFYSSSTSFTSFLRNLLGAEKSEKIDSNGFVSLLKSRLEDGDVPVIYGKFDGGLHAVNAISLVQHNDNSNHYSIGVYDNNYPGEKRYIDMICNKSSCVTEKNEYYSNSNQPIRITQSLEYDLSFYK